MKITLLCGAGINSLLNKLSEIKGRYSTLEILELEGRDLDLNRLTLEVGSGGLFSKRRLLIIRNLDAKINFESIAQDENLHLVLIFNKTFNSESGILKWVKGRGGEIFAFNEGDERSIFPFLDLLAMKDLRALVEFESLYQKFGGQYLLTMVFYLLRKYILPAKKMPDWVVKKQVSQRASFTPERINNLYRECLEADFKIKSGLMDEKIGLTLLLNKFYS